MPASAPELSRFKESLHSSFIVRHGGVVLATLSLDEINVFGTRPGWESFSLIFGGPCPAAFSSGLLEVEHAELGRFPLFLVAVITDGDGQHYEAVFHRPST